MILQLLQGVLQRPALFRSQLFHIRHQHCGEFLVGDTTQRSILIMERQIGEIIERREQTYLCKFGHSRDKYKLQIVGSGL